MSLTGSAFLDQHSEVINTMRRVINIIRQVKIIREWNQELKIVRTAKRLL